MTDTKNASLAKRLLICAFGMFFYASGVAITKNCNLGISAIISVAYVLSMIIPVSMGWCTTIVNLVYFLFQRLLLRREYPMWMMLAQFFMSMVFSVAVDLTAEFFGFMQSLTLAYPVRILVFVFGCAVMALGILLVVFADFVVLPAEGCVNAMVQRSHMRFGTCKILFDAAMVAVTILFSLIFFGKILGIREGTLIAVLLIGTFAKHIGAALWPVLNRFTAVEK